MKSLLSFLLLIISLSTPAQITTNGTFAKIDRDQDKLFLNQQLGDL